MLLCCLTVRLRPHHAAVQYVPRSMEDSETQTAVEGEELREFLTKVCPRCVRVCVCATWGVLSAAVNAQVVLQHIVIAP